MPVAIESTLPEIASLTKTKLWMPEQVLFTPAAIEEPWGQQILARIQSLNLPIKILSHNRITGLRGETDRETYQIAKRTLAVVTAPPSSFKLSPIPPSADWQLHYGQLLDSIATALDFDCDLTFELISHRFTPGSKATILKWYPQTKLEMEESTRTAKRNKFGGTKYVYEKDVMKELHGFFDRELSRRFPHAKILYWT